MDILIIILILAPRLGPLCAHALTTQFTGILHDLWGATRDNDSSQQH